MTNYLKYLKPGFWLANQKYLDAAGRRAQSLAIRWDVPQGDDTTEDLRDVQSRYTLTAPDESGRQQRVGGTMKPDDMHEGYYSEAIPLLFMLMPILGMIAFVSSAGSDGQGGSTLLKVAACAAMVVIMSCIATATKSMKWAFSSAALSLGLPLLVAGMQSGNTNPGSAQQNVLSSLIDLAKSQGSTGLIVLAALGGVLFYFGGKRDKRGLLGGGAALIADVYVASIVWPWLSGIVLALPALCLGYLWARDLEYDRAFDLTKQGNASNWEASKWVTAHIPGRRKQAIQAKKDDAMAPVVHLGTASGEFSSRNDPWAPDAGLPFVMNVLNFGTHLMLTGLTGTGKTKLIMKIVIGWVRSKNSGQKVGLLVMDGKSSLAVIFRRLMGYVILDPARVMVGLYQNLSASDVTRTLRELSVSDDTNKKDKMWEEEATNLCNYSALMVEALVHISKGAPEEERVWRWTPHDHYAFAMMGIEGANAEREILPEAEQTQTTAKTNLLAYIDAVYDKHPEGKVGLLKDARDYFTVTLPSTPAVTMGGISSNFSSWITPMFGNRHLLTWCQSESGVEVESCLHGAFIGINMPYARYARAGQIAQTFLKARFFSAIRKRADAPNGDWQKHDPTATPVLSVLDEAHLLIGDGDLEIAAIARSLGLALCVSAQGLESYKSVSKNVDKVMAFLDSFKSKITLAASKGTFNYMSDYIGKVWRPSFSEAGSIAIDMVGSVASASESQIYNQHHALARWMKKFRRMGAGQFVNPLSGKRADVKTDLALQMRTSHGKVWEETPLVNETDFHTFTAAHGIALATVIRGNSPRRDFIQLDTMIDDLPDDICDPDFVDEEELKLDAEAAIAVSEKEEEEQVQIEEALAA
jgi:hypothetical protein